MTTASLIFILLFLSLIFAVFQRGKFVKFAMYFRAISVVFAIIFYANLFYRQSTERLVKDAVSVQVINGIPQPLDFYTIKRSNDKTLEISHLEVIRPEHFRTFYDTVRAPHQLWLAGFLGKKNMVYFAEVPVLNHSEDKIVNVEKYENQNEQNSEIATQEIEKFKMNGVTKAVFATLAFLLLFINIFILLKNLGRRFV